MSIAHPTVIPQATPAPAAPAPSPRPFRLIGELINHSFARAARAWEARDVAGYQRLAKLQADLGADYITLNSKGIGYMVWGLKNGHLTPPANGRNGTRPTLPPQPPDAPKSVAEAEARARARGWNPEEFDEL